MSIIKIIVNTVLREFAQYLCTAVDSTVWNHISKKEVCIVKYDLLKIPHFTEFGCYL